MRSVPAIAVLVSLLDGAVPGWIGWPQGTEIVGRVLDQTRLPVDGVEVIVNRRDVRARSDSTGVFKLTISPDDSTVAFRRIGYLSVVFAIRPLPSSVDTLFVHLDASAVVLSEVIVSAKATKPLRYAFTTKFDGVFNRRKMRLGTLVPRETIDARFGSSTDQLLNGIAGIHVWNGPPKRIRFARCSEPGGVGVYIDGVRQNSSLTPSAGADISGLLYKPPSSPNSLAMDMEPEIEILSRVNPSDIEMIEVFRGAAELPAEFHWNGCAVIAIWTRAN